MISLFQVLKEIPCTKEEPVSDISIFEKEVGSSS